MYVLALFGLPKCNLTGYALAMIRSFRHKGLRRYFCEPRFQDRRGISAEISKRVKLILEALDIIEIPEEMDIVGFFFHELKGTRKGTFSVRVSGNYRITWKMSGNDVMNVDLEDYH